LPSSTDEQFVTFDPKKHSTVVWNAPHDFDEDLRASSAVDAESVGYLINTSVT